MVTPWRERAMLLMSVACTSVVSLRRVWIAHHRTVPSHHKHTYDDHAAARQTRVQCSYDIRMHLCMLRCEHVLEYAPVHLLHNQRRRVTH